MTFIYRVAVTLGILCASGHVVAAAAPFAQAPASLRDFFIKARAADRIADPMQRCLAFPDYPGNRWPAGSAAARCKLEFEERISTSTITRLVDQGAAAELDALFMRDLNRHFSKTDFSEIIHADLNQTIVAAIQDELTQKWIDLAPESPFANLARGRFLLDQAEQARGGGYASATPAENMRRMSDFVAKAVKLFDKAIRLEPRLLPAFAGLIDAAKLDSLDGIGQRAFARAQALDPGCREVARVWMWHLTPLWGGSYEDMAQYAAQLSKLAPKRPLLGEVIALADSDRAHALRAGGDMPGAIAMLERAAKATAARGPMSEAGEYMVLAKNENWEALARLTAAYRFGQRTLWEASTRTRLLMALADNQTWALDQLKLAFKRWPDSYLASQLLKAGRATGDLEACETALTKLAADPGTGNYAQFELFRLALAQKQVEKADRYAQIVLNSFPQLSQRMLVGAYLAMRSGDEKMAADAFKAYIEFVDARHYDMPDEVALAKRYLNGERDPVLTGKAN